MGRRIAAATQMQSQSLIGFMGTEGGNVGEPGSGQVGGQAGWRPGRLGTQNPFLIEPALIHIDTDDEFCTT